MKTLEIDRLSVSYDGLTNAVNKCSLMVNEKEIITIVGESGSGKSTLLHTVLGLLPQNCIVSANKMEFMGEDLLFPHTKGETKKIFSPKVRFMRGDKIAMIFQNAGRYMNPTQTIGKQYKTFLHYHGRYTEKECYNLAADMFEKMKLKNPEQIWKSYPFELSGGMCQRVAIAMAMTSKPKLLLADEPTSALDVTVQAQVIKLLLELRDTFDTSIILVTHNMGVAAFISDRIGIMKDGELLEIDEAKQIIEHPQHNYTKTLIASVIEPEDSRFVK